MLAIYGGLFLAAFTVMAYAFARASDFWTWTEQRMARRYRTRSRAQIVVLGDEAIGCSVADISATGARVLVDPAASVPDSFILKLRGRARRCSVVWRGVGQVGLAFKDDA
jgi:hypothetical protein